MRRSVGTMPSSRDSEWYNLVSKAKGTRPLLEAGRPPVGMERPAAVLYDATPELTTEAEAPSHKTDERMAMTKDKNPRPKGETRGSRANRRPPRPPSSSSSSCHHRRGHHHRPDGGPHLLSARIICKLRRARCSAAAMHGTLRRSSVESGGRAQMWHRGSVESRDCDDEQACGR